MWLKLASGFKIVKVRTDRQAGSTIALLFFLRNQAKKRGFDSVIDTGVCEQNK